MSLLSRKPGEGRRRGTPADLLVVGLGNPGAEFESTRHNVGADLVAVLARRHGEKLSRGKERAQVAELRIGAKRVAVAFPQTFMNNSGWQGARKRVGLSQVRVHDLKHTFGRRLRAAGESYEDRQDLLGHKSGRITTHYSAAELENLIEAANRVCGENSRKSPALVLLKQKAATAETVTA